MRYRVFTEADFAALRRLDEQQQGDCVTFAAIDAREREGRLRSSQAALKFFERSEHSFVAEDESGLHGVILAQSVWQGDRPIVLVARVLSAPQAPAGTLEGLLHACVKSAYDSAVYEVHYPLTPELSAAAEKEEARVIGHYAVSFLGSRAHSAPYPLASSAPIPRRDV